MATARIPQPTKAAKPFMGTREEARAAGAIRYAADAEPLDAAYALWSTFTGILLAHGWSACDLSEDAHELQATMAGEDGGNEPVVVQ